MYISRYERPNERPNERTKRAKINKNTYYSHIQRTNEKKTVRLKFKIKKKQKKWTRKMKRGKTPKKKHERTKGKKLMWIEKYTHAIHRFRLGRDS